MVLNTVSSAPNESKFRISWRSPALADRMNLLWMLLCCWACSSLGFVQSMEHCLTHRYQESMNSSHMQFTKEISSTEFAVLGSFKSLHCCAKGYRSIEWIKNGVPYPWPAETSSFILYPEAANQTIFTRQVQLSDIGNYSCVLRNDTHKKVHHISLEVQGNLPDMPLATFKPRDEIVELGNPARLYCEAFVGKVSLPDAKSEISWYQVFEGGLEQEIDGIQEQITREDGEIVGSYLRIPKVQLHNYGRYLCRIQIGDTSHRLDMYAFLYGSPIEAENNETLLLALAAAICAVFLVLIAWYLIVWCYRTNRKNRNQCRAMAKAELTSPPRRV